MKKRTKVAVVLLIVALIASSGVYLFFARSSHAGTTTLGIQCIDSSPPQCAHAYLRYADLSGDELSGGNFTGADLRNVNFEQADLENATLYGANLSNTNFTDADLTGANLNGTQYNNAIYCDTIMPDGSVNYLDCSQ